ncbi:restriction endonuclease subunit S [Agathobacter rectalis]|uniref:EcoKI restriction-modification system protein HsdS n=1 Tax=Agathobacter rectalis TaxID=39491 RepID=A0A174KN55_9FIRM|nr:restriction endonuclease subunit S [Agathobacter rectalis]CUP11025.1 EcoKI restriction-modification system protein HsdS [Agathobacter rectalis]
MENPKIRFKGYTKDWEQRKFSEFVENVAVRNREGLELECYAVTNDRGFISQKEAHDDFGYMADVDKTAYNIVPPNSFAYNPARINVGSIGYYAGTENVIVSSLYEVFQTADYVEDGFLWHWFKSTHFPKWIERLQEGSVRLYFYYDKLIQCEMKMPSLEEQKKIGKYFDNLDHLITLHQRKCEQTKKLKKYMLQKMFPQNGAKVPEIRFDGFTYDWEQRKFSELYARSSEKNDGSIGMDKNITVATMQFKNDVKVSTTEYLKTYYTFKLGDIAFEGHQSKEFRYGRFVENDIGNGIVSHIFAVFRPIQEYDLYFWKYAINNETLMQRILARSTKASTMMHDLVTNDFLNETFLVPSVKEQKQIGAFLNKLDNLITLHQRKCDELKKMKKYMLQNMFI